MFWSSDNATVRLRKPEPPLIRRTKRPFYEIWNIPLRTGHPNTAKELVIGSYFSNTPVG